MQTHQNFQQVNYTFNIGEFSLKDLSSKSSKYGRWGFIDSFGYENRLTAKLGILFSNTSGDFVLQLSHTALLRTHLTYDRDHGTDIIKVADG